MNRLQTMESVVFKVLDERPETRKDDYLLMLAVCEELTPEIIKCSFASVLYNPRRYCLEQIGGRY